jgi:signal transduction histidine kinase
MATAASRTSDSPFPADRRPSHAQVEQEFHQRLRKLVHEVSNPLTVIRNRLELLALRYPDAQPLQNESRLLGAELDRIDSLLRRAAGLAADEEAAHCDVARLLADMRAMYEEPLFAARGIGFELHLSSDTGRAAMAADALRQVLLNLWLNAAEALQPGQRMSVAVAGIELGGRACVEIRLTDNGPGLSAERAHDPFGLYGSAKGGRHRGVGLAVVKEILDRWQAIIRHHSDDGVGTCFRLYIPSDRTSTELHQSVTKPRTD